jgi:hypothetical protein
MSGRPRPGQYVTLYVTVTSSGSPVSGATVDAVLDTLGADQSAQKITNSTGSASFWFLTRYSDRYPWTIRITATKGDLTASKTCTYKGLVLSCQ